MAEIKIEFGKERLEKEYMDEFLGYHYPVVVTKRAMFIDKDSCTEDDFSNPKFLEKIKSKVREIIINSPDYIEEIRDYDDVHKYRKIYLCNLKLMGRSSVTNNFEIKCIMKSFGSPETLHYLNVGVGVQWE